MNHLAHFKLAAGDPHLLAGALLGDHVKGRLVGRMDPRLEVGIRIHREVDGYPDAHAITSRGYRRLPDRFRRFGPILVDVIYDHLLAKHWDDFHDAPLHDFSRQTFAAIERLEEELPQWTVTAAQRMKQSGILERYRNLTTIEGVLRNISGRLRRPNPVAEALPPLRDNLDALREDFYEFFPQLERFVSERLGQIGQQLSSNEEIGAM